MTQPSVPVGDGPESIVNSFIHPDLLEERMNAAHAADLDARIDERLERMGKTLARALFELGCDLSRMKASRGYLRLGYKSWEGYLESKRAYGRTYLSYVLKLGQAEDLEPCLSLGMRGAQLVEFAKHTDFPKKLPQLIEATWPEVQAKSIRQMRDFLDDFVQAHRDEYKKPEKRDVLLIKGPSQKWRQSFKRQFERLPDTDREAFLAEMEAFVIACRVDQA